MMAFSPTACSPMCMWLAMALVAGAAPVLLAAEAAPPRPALPTPDVANESYGPHERNKVDLWLAKSDAPTPVMVYIHGGGFMGGDKNTADPAEVRDFLRNGISYAAINYRLTNAAPYPAQMMDAARAIQFIRQNAAKWNIDPTRVAATGGSAGAGMSLWLGFHDDLADPKAQEPVARQSTRLSCAVVLAAQDTYDPREIKKIVPGNAYDHVAMKRLFGLPDTWNWDTQTVSPEVDKLIKECGPITHLSKGDAPVLVIHYSGSNKVGDIHNGNFGIHLKQKMDEVGIECIRRMDTDYRDLGTTFARERMEFVRKHFGMEAAK